MKRNIKKSCLVLRKKFFLLASVFFLFAPRISGAAEITLDNVEMASRGRVNDGEFQVTSMLSADLALSGGYKYAFLLGFSLEAADIAKAFAYRDFAFKPITATPTAAEYNALAERLNNQASLGFRVAKASVKDIFGLPLEMAYFIGAADDFCTGDEFSSRFGLAPFGTEFRGFYYFPDSKRYDGIYGVRGTGFSFTLTKWANIVPSFYLYKDFVFSGGAGGIAEENLYSGDMRLLFNDSRLRLEAFTGLSLDPALDASFRGGLMVNLAGNGVEFFAQGGIPGWTVGEKFSIDNLSFLLEPRLHFAVCSLFVTFFYHPSEYLHYPTDEQGWADLNVKFQFGERGADMVGGIEAGGDLKNNSVENFVLRIAPYGRLVFGGLQWDAKFQIKPLAFDIPAEMFELFIGVRTAF